VVITGIAWIDYQYLSEGYRVRWMNPGHRQLLHLLILCTITAAGYLFLKSHPVQWLKKLWTFSYSLVLFLLVFSGIVQLLSKALPIGYLDFLSTLRLFFCSPMPFLMLYLFAMLLPRLQSSGGNATDGGS
jgi:hypothetical protein